CQKRPHFCLSVFFQCEESVLVLSQRDVVLPEEVLAFLPEVFVDRHGLLALLRRIADKVVVAAVETAAAGETVGSVETAGLVVPVDSVGMGAFGTVVVMANQAIGATDAIIPMVVHRMLMGGIGGQIVACRLRMGCPAEEQG